MHFSITHHSTYTQLYVPTIWNERTNKRAITMSSGDIKQHFSNNANQPHSHTHTLDAKCSPMTFQNGILLNVWCVECVYLKLKNHVGRQTANTQTLNVPEAVVLYCFHAGKVDAVYCLFVINYAKFNIVCACNTRYSHFVLFEIAPWIIWGICLVDQSCMWETVLKAFAKSWISTLNLVVLHWFFSESKNVLLSWHRVTFRGYC